MNIWRKIRTSWFPSSIVLALLLCWYLLHLVHNTPGVEPVEDHDPFKDMPQDFPNIFGRSPNLRIIVLTYNRPASLKRLLKSIALADYKGDRISLDIWVDRSPNGEIHNETYQLAREFVFKAGDKNVYAHGEHFGVLKQWIRTWKFLANPREIAVFLEDDLTVSPQYYRWLKVVHETYEDDDIIGGFALQGAQAIHSGRNTLENINVSSEYLTYLYPMAGTWGFSPKFRQWHKFILWYNKYSEDESFTPNIPDNIVSSWYSKARKKGTPDNMWSIWYSYYNLKYKQYVVYPNIQPKFQGFTYNFKEEGMNAHGHALKPETGTLVTEWSSKYEKLPKLPPFVAPNGTVTVDLKRKIPPRGPISLDFPTEFKEF